MRGQKTYQATTALALALLLTTATGCAIKMFGRNIDTSGLSTGEIEEAIARTASRWRNRDWSRANVLCRNFGNRPVLTDALADREDRDFTKEELRAIRICGVEEGSSEIVLWMSWGSPNELNELASAQGVREEEWVYYGPYRASRRQYFYLTDGIVQDWESGR
jgi:hypothetical protein